MKKLPDPENPDQPTAAHLLAEKIDRDGPVQLGEYMAIANSHYYASGDPLGEAGDFVTAPEISQMFGEMIGLWLTDLWMRKGSPDNAHYVELGPGRGTLADDARRVMMKFGCTPPIHFVETSPVLREKQKQKHRDAIWHDSIESLPEDGPLMIVANEFFDALPVEQFVLNNGGWRHHMVARNRNKFVVIPGPSLVEVQVPDSRNRFPEGTIIEQSPASIAIIGDLADRLTRQGGVMLIIDYGYDQPGTGSTLQAVKNHLPISPFDSPGDSDLTAHVNFHALANAARNRLLTVHGPIEQGQWLKSLGIEQRAANLVMARPDEAHKIRAGYARLTDVEEMGRLFRVMAATSMDWPEPDGMAYGGDDISR